MKVRMEWESGWNKEINRDTDEKEAGPKENVPLFLSASPIHPFPIIFPCIFFAPSFPRYFREFFLSGRQFFRIIYAGCCERRNGDR